MLIAYYWRHDSASTSLVNGLRDHIEDTVTRCADLTNMRAGNNPPATIPENILINSTGPDIMLVEDEEITLLELTIPHGFMESIANARYRKYMEANYQQTLDDLDDEALTVVTQRLEEDDTDSRTI